MSSLVGKLISNISAQVQPPQNYANGGQPNILAIHKSKLEPGAFDITPFGLAPVQAPLYHISTSKSNKPNVVVYKGNAEVFQACLHTFSSKVDVVANRQSMTMSQSSLSGSLTIHHPQLGELKWKVNQNTGSSAKLIDSRGTNIAVFKSNHMPGMGDKKLELLMPVDPMFLDLLVGSAMTLKILLKAMNETAMDAAEAAIDAGAAA